MKDSTPNTLVATSGRATQFCHADDKFWITRLCGMITGKLGEDTGPVRARGVAVVNVDGRRYEGRDLALEGVDESDGTVVSHWTVGHTPLRLRCIGRCAPIPTSSADAIL